MVFARVGRIDSTRSTAVRGVEVFFEAAFLGAAFFELVLRLAVFLAAFFEALLVAGLFRVVAFLLAFEVAFLAVFFAAGFFAAGFFAAGFLPAVLVAPVRLVLLAFLVELAEDFVAVFLRVVGRCLAAIGGSWS